jgi:UDP-glucose 4-epimerase
MSSIKTFSKAIILGSSGFIGLNLAKALITRGMDVVCFDRNPSQHMPDGCHFVKGDVSSAPKELIDHLNNAVVFHLVSSGRPSPNTSKAVEEIGDISATVKLLEDTQGKNIRWVYLSSGGTVYGASKEEILNETSTTMPICSYGVTKLAIERYFSLYGNLHGTDFVTVRLANPYGPWQDPKRGQGLIMAAIYRGLTNDAIEIWGDGSAVRDYIYIADAIDGLISAADIGKSQETYNLGSGKGTSISEVLQTISHVIDIKLNITLRPNRGVDVAKNVLICDKFLTHTDWKSETILVDGIKKSCDWIKTHYKI